MGIITFKRISTSLNMGIMIHWHDIDRIGISKECHIMDVLRNYRNIDIIDTTKVSLRYFGMGKDTLLSNGGYVIRKASN